MNKNTKLNIIMIGPDLSVKGGISFVVKEYLNAGLEKWVAFKFIPSHEDGSKLYKIWIFIKAFFHFSTVLLNTSNTIIHLHVSQDGSFVRKFILFLMAKLFRKQTIVHLHGSDFEEFMNKTKVHQSLTRHMFNKADRVLALSDQWKSLVTEFAQNAKIVTLYNPIKPRMIIDQSVDRLKVIFLGRLGKRKGTYDLLECIFKYSEYFTQNNILFILGGDGDVEKVRELVSKQGLEDIIEIPGWVSQQDKEHLMESSHIMILPTHKEQMPMSILEGMAYGYPIVATNVAGIPEMVEQGGNGLLFEPGDIDAMFSGLKQLCEHRELRERMGTRSIEIVKEKFERNMITHKLVKMYYEVNGEKLKE